jgi:hypothetical protein
MAKNQPVKELVLTITVQVPQDFALEYPHLACSERALTDFVLHNADQITGEYTFVNGLTAKIDALVNPPHSALYEDPG